MYCSEWSCDWLLQDADDTHNVIEDAVSGIDRSVSKLENLTNSTLTLEHLTQLQTLYTRLTQIIDKYSWEWFQDWWN